MTDVEMTYAAHTLLKLHKADAKSRTTLVREADAKSRTTLVRVRVQT